MSKPRRDRTWPRPRTTRHAWFKDSPEPGEPPRQVLIIERKRHSYKWAARIVYCVDIDGADGHAVVGWVPGESLRPARTDPNVGEILFLRGQVWRESAQNVAESFSKGMRVIVSGRLKSRTFETKEGEKRTVIEHEVAEIGPSLQYATFRREFTKSGQGAEQTPMQ